jgi:hypothetical protein
LGEEAWTAYLASFPPNLKKELTTRFNVKTGSETSKKGEEYKAEEE